MRSKHFTLAICLGLIGGCGSVDHTAKLVSAPIEDVPALGSLKFRDETIHIYVGPRYTVERADGMIEARLLTADELRALDSDAAWFIGEGLFASSFGHAANLD